MRKNLSRVASLLLLPWLLMGADECEMPAAEDAGPEDSGREDSGPEDSGPDANDGFEDCINGRDDNGNGQVDCDDAACARDAACLVVVVVDEVCDDRVDNDDDGRIDCGDPDCADSQACVVEEVEVCDDRIDNDGDGATDCSDSDCEDHAHCSACGDVEICDNEIDDDCDGAIDCNDPECTRAPACYDDPLIPTDCNVIDQDCGDGYRCYPGGLTAEEGQCYGDGGRSLGQTCEGLPVNVPEACSAGLLCIGLREICDDGIDNDRDGDVDWEDCDCSCSCWFRCWECGGFDDEECWDTCRNCDENTEYDCDVCQEIEDERVGVCMDICGPGTCDDGFSCRALDFGLDEPSADWGVCVEEIPEEVCTDGEDNDRDNAIDCDDSDCANHERCRPCDVFAQDCFDPAHMCVLVHNSTNECIEPGSGAEGAFCNEAGDCERGLQCAALTGYLPDEDVGTFTLSPSYLSRGGVCSRACQAGAAETGCDRDQRCGYLYWPYGRRSEGICHDPISM